VENWNKHIYEKRIVRQVGYLQEFVRMFLLYGWLDQKPVLDDCTERKKCPTSLHRTRCFTQIG